MKRAWMRWALLAICALLLLCGCALAETYDLGEALALVGTEAGRAGDGMLELNEDLEEVSFFVPDAFQSSGGRSIILWREGPEKAFEIRYAPISEDYEGKDAGDGHVYLCAALMEQIPEEKRARTPEEIENVLIVETRYVVSGVITSRMGDNREELPALSEIEKRIESGEGDTAIPEEDEGAVELTYKPVFSCYMMCYLYNLPTNSSSMLDYEVGEHGEMRRNPEAADLWDHLVELATLTPTGEGEDEEAPLTALLGGSLEELLSEDEYADVLEAILGGDMRELGALCDELFWSKAEGLKELDPEAEQHYGEAISARSYSAIGYIANARGYSAVDRSDLLIQLSRSYLGRPDSEVLDGLMRDAMELMEAAEWDMELIGLLNSLE